MVQPNLSSIRRKKKSFEIIPGICTPNELRDFDLHLRQRSASHHGTSHNCLAITIITLVYPRAPGSHTEGCSMIKKQRYAANLPAPITAGPCLVSARAILWCLRTPALTAVTTPSPAHTAPSSSSKVSPVGPLAAQTLQSHRPRNAKVGTLDGVSDGVGGFVAAEGEGVGLLAVPLRHKPVAYLPDLREAFGRVFRKELGGRGHLAPIAHVARLAHSNLSSAP